ncbi:MAG: 16S rRNA (cytidine(1402)-2'-O)-methyltransferase, partial [Ruminococcus sp.]|nr:16S rRNA (cytidine(1402)-2'-O)-methyltransferase [Ruminococcus sp.]
AAAHYADGSVRGEIVLVLEGCPQPEEAPAYTLEAAVALAREWMADGKKATEAAKEAAAATGFKKNEIYRELML